MFNFYFNFRMNDETRRQLILLSKALKRTKSNLLRWLLHQEFLRQGFEPLESMEESHSTSESNEGVDDD